MEKQVSIDIIEEGPVAVVAFKATSISGVEGVAAASKQIRAFIDENHPNGIVFDFEQVKFFSSQVLGVLLNTRAELETYNGEVVISAINPQLHRVFKITNLDSVFSFFPDRESAIRAVVPKNKD
jgi:anti-sigma B factor antagonist